MPSARQRSSISRHGVKRFLEVDKQAKQKVVVMTSTINQVSKDKEPVQRAVALPKAALRGRTQAVRLRRSVGAGIQHALNTLPRMLCINRNYGNAAITIHVPFATLALVNRRERIHTKLVGVLVRVGQNVVVNPREGGREQRVVIAVIGGCACVLQTFRGEAKGVCCLVIRQGRDGRRDLLLGEGVVKRAQVGGRRLAELKLQCDFRHGRLLARRACV